MENGVAEVRVRFIVPDNIEEDSITKLMTRLGIPATRENYLNLAYLGDPPDEIDPEIEAEIPIQFRLRSDPDDWAEIK
jgi:hypothetical protein